MGRQDQYANTLLVDGRPLGVYDKFSGGDMDSSETKYMAGGMEPEQSLGGPQKVTNVIVTRKYDLERDHDLVRWLKDRRGKASATVNRQPLDVDGNPYGKPLVYTGKLKSVKLGGTDSNATAADTYDVEISTEGNVG